MEDRDTFREIANGDALAFRVGTWITLRGENDRDGETRFRLDCDRVEVPLRAGLNDVSTHASSCRCTLAHQKDCSKIDLVREKKHEGFGFGIAEAYIVLENFWP